MTRLVPVPELQSPDSQSVQIRDHGSRFVIQNGLDPEVDLRGLWRALKRRKKLVGVIAICVVAASGVVGAYQRVFNPLFRGSFALLITDPISNNSGPIRLRQRGLLSGGLH